MTEVVRPTEVVAIYANCLSGLSVWMGRRRILDRIERYRQLIRVMRGLSKHERERHFDMESWGRKTPCGTTMCAAGFCGVDPWFQERGFVFEPTYENSRNFVVRYRNDSSWYAIEAFFGVLPHERAGGAPKHRVFMLPKSVNQVIIAARQRIKDLKAML
jgi:hypothetical protein